MVLHVELLPTLQPSEGAFSDVDRFIQESFLGASPQTPIFPSCCWETNIQSIVFLEKSLKTKTYPRGGTYIYIDVPLEEVLPPRLGCAKASLVLA